MTKRIIYTNATGGVSILIPAENIRLTIDQVAEKDVPNGVTFEIVDTSAIPTERTFRNAWRKNGKAVQTDMPAAREIAHTMRRGARDEEMKPLDVQATIPSQAQAAEAARQIVRDKYADVQIAIDASTNEGELLAAMDKME